MKMYFFKRVCLAVGQIADCLIGGPQIARLALQELLDGGHHGVLDVVAVNVLVHLHTGFLQLVEVLVLVSEEVLVGPILHLVGGLSDDVLLILGQAVPDIHAEQVEDGGVHVVG